MNCQASAQVLCSITNLAIVFRLNRFHNFNGLHFMDFLGWVGFSQYYTLGDNYIMYVLYYLRGKFLRTVIQNLKLVGLR